jgi:hypothetical protein
LYELALDALQGEQGFWRNRQADTARLPRHAPNEARRSSMSTIECTLGGRDVKIPFTESAAVTVSSCLVRVYDRAIFAPSGNAITSGTKILQFR